jgi:hypothetical protein
MEQAILEAEAELASAGEHLDDPDVATDPERAQAAFEVQQRAQERVDRLYARWAELEEKSGGAGES